MEKERDSVQQEELLMELLEATFGEDDGVYTDNGLYEPDSDEDWETDDELVSAMEWADLREGIGSSCMRV